MAVQSCLNLAMSITTKYMNFLFRLDLHCCLHGRFAYVFMQKRSALTIYSSIQASLFGLSRLRNVML